MARHDQPPANAVWIIIAVAALFFGGVLGYVLGTGGSAPRPAPAAVSPSQPAPGVAPAPHVIDERQVQAYRDILARDPKNARAATELANLLYDAGRYGEAIPLYRQALAADAANVSVRTDLGTALWYAGRPDEAIAEYERSLAVNPTHPQTLFNMGIVRMDGKQDPRGAIESWEKLLATNPGYQDAAKVRQLIDKARQQAGG